MQWTIDGNHAYAPTEYGTYKILTSIEHGKPKFSAYLDEELLGQSSDVHEAKKQVETDFSYREHVWEAM